MRQRARLGMAMFLLNEVVFFFLLIAAFVYLRNPGAAAGSLHLAPAAVYTACLLASSVTMGVAARSKPGRGRAWVGITIALGTVFLAGQAREYVRLFHQNLTISSSVFGTTFFTLTGMHGLHVAIGIVLLGILLAPAPAGDFGEQQTVALEIVAWYWYFVDAVWLGIFAVVYLGTFL